MSKESLDITKFDQLLDSKKRKVPKMYIDRSNGEEIKIQWKKNKGFIKL